MLPPKSPKTHANIRQNQLIITNQVNIKKQQHSNVIRSNLKFPRLPLPELRSSLKSNRISSSSVRPTSANEVIRFECLLRRKKKYHDHIIILTIVSVLIIYENHQISNKIIPIISKEKYHDFDDILMVITTEAKAVIGIMVIIQ